MGELERIFRSANERLMAEVRENPYLWGLGTTLTLGIVCQERLFFGHVGDSRLYLWREGVCEQLTEDHTRASELAKQGVISQAAAARSAQRNVLTRYLGTANVVEPQMGSFDLRLGDRILLCSDGLYTSLEPEQMEWLLGADLEPGELAERLVVEARSRAGEQQDNITALVVAVDG